MNLVMQIIGLTTCQPTPFDGMYLMEYDPDQSGVDPNGNPMLAHIACTSDPLQAKRYVDLMALRDDWARVSKTQPIRPDGGPNRPLTAFTITPVQVPEAVDGE